MPHPQKKKQVYELTDMHTHEVSMVNIGANLRKYLMVKTRGAKLALSPEQREILSAIMLDALEKITAVAQTIKEAEVDDAATDGAIVIVGMMAEASEVLGHARRVLDDTNSGDDDDESTSTAKARTARRDPDKWDPQAIDDLAAHVLRKGHAPQASDRTDDFAAWLADVESYQRRPQTERMTAAELLASDDFSDAITRGGQR